MKIRKNAKTRTVQINEDSYKIIGESAEARYWKWCIDLKQELWQTKSLKNDEINADTDDVHDIDELNGSTTVGRLLEIMKDANAEADKDSFDLEWSYRRRNNINQ